MRKIKTFITIVFFSAPLFYAAYMAWIFLGPSNAAVPAQKSPKYTISENIVSPIYPIEVNQRKVSLGKKLFRDKNLSADSTISCASCHSSKHGGADLRRFSIGVTGKSLPVNTPTVFNAVFNVAQYWDGRASSLEDQAGQPLLHKDEMGMTWPLIIRRLYKNKDYVSEFSQIYSDNITSENVIDAIVEYEKSLTTPNSRFDRYLKGDKGALNSVEKKGYKLFKNYGCVSCHQGRNLGGNLYQKFGIIREYFDSDNISKADLGRYNITGDLRDKHVFKVPSLRNVAITAPYFHDGSADSLEAAVSTMAYHQLGLNLEGNEVEQITAFLKTLTGKLE